MSDLLDLYIQRERYRQRAVEILEAAHWHYNCELDSWSGGPYVDLDIDSAANVEIQRNIGAIMSKMNEGFLNV